MSVMGSIVAFMALRARAQLALVSHKLTCRHSQAQRISLEDVILKKKKKSVRILIPGHRKKKEKEKQASSNAVQILIPGHRKKKEKRKRSQFQS